MNKRNHPEDEIYEVFKELRKWPVLDQSDSYYDDIEDIFKFGIRKEDKLK